jgi:hypothetical protein
MAPEPIWLRSENLVCSFAGRQTMAASVDVVDAKIGLDPRVVTQVTPRMMQGVPANLTY